MTDYDPRPVVAFYDEHGHREGSRPPSPADEVSWRIHRRLLTLLVRPGDRVLEVGAGLGQVTQELGRLGARVVATDIAPEQLERHRRQLQATGLEQAVESRMLLDLTALDRLPEEAFDAVVCYRGPLGYALEQADPGIRMMVARLRRGGHLMLSAWSFHGCLSSLARVGTGDWLKEVCETRVVRAPNAPPYRLFASAELVAMIRDAGASMVRISADGVYANWPTVAGRQLAPAAQSLLNACDEEACQVPGLLDAGRRIVLAAQRSGASASC
jgi:2-polyprenyl-3-methyl-5-hydroxy-6-metoxy-1,4-benzoquinol methylase